MPHGKKHRDPGAVQRAMKREAAERKKDAAFIKKHGLGIKPKPKKNYDPKKGSPKAVRSMTAKIGSGKTKPVPMPKVKNKSKAITKGFYSQPTVRIIESPLQRNLRMKKK